MDPVLMVGMNSSNACSSQKVTHHDLIKLVVRFSLKKEAILNQHINFNSTRRFDMKPHIFSVKKNSRSKNLSLISLPGKMHEFKKVPFVVQRKRRS